MRSYNPMSDAQSYLTDDQLKALMEAAKGINEQVFILINTLAYTGRRISEVVRGPHGYGMRPKDIDFIAYNITYRILKKHPRKVDYSTKLETESREQFRRRMTMEGKLMYREPESVTLPANDMILALLKNYIETYNIGADDYIFPFNREYASRMLKKVARAAGIEKVGKYLIHPHVFRHTFAIRVTRQPNSKPEDIVTLQYLLQHADINMTMTYLRYGPTRGRELVNSL